MSTVTVLVTGASGYIACHIVKLLLERGYNVRGTVRNLQDSEKCNPLTNLAAEVRQNFSSSTNELTLVQADLLSPDGWTEVVKGCDYVIHTASPFPSKTPKDCEELIKPALGGTLHVLEACRATTGIKRVVLTSSIATILGDGSKKTEYNESDWTNPDILLTVKGAYQKSKTLAEKAAWDFVESNNHPFELAVINPGFVMGPLLHNSRCTRLEFLNRRMNFEMPMLAKGSLPIADVRDVADAHVKSMTCPEANGNRHIIVTCTMWLQEVADVVRQEFQPKGYRIPSMVAPYCFLWLASWWDNSLKLVLKHCNQFPTLDNSRMQKVLGIKPTGTKETILDMAYSLIERGFVKKVAQ